MALRPTTHLTAALALTAAVAAACTDRSPGEGLVRTLPPTPEIATRPAVATRKGSKAKIEKTASPVVTTVARPVSYRAAEEAFRHRRFGEAASLFARLAEADPDRHRVRYMHGLSSLKAGDLGTAEAAFCRVLAIAPEDVKTLQNLGRVLLGQQRPADAFELLQVALDIDRTSNVTHRLTGRALAALGRTADAAEAYGEAILLDETDAFAMNNLALLRLDQGSPDAALPLLARAVAIGDDVALFHNNLGVALERVGRPRSAVEAYRRALLLDPGSERVALNLERIEPLAEADTQPLMDIDRLGERFARVVRAGGAGVDVEP